MTLDPHITSELQKALPWAQDVSLRESVDESGDAALVVFLVVDSESIGSAAKVAEARRAVAAVFEKYSVASWPYVRFVSEPAANASGN